MMKRPQISTCLPLWKSKVSLNESIKLDALLRLMKSIGYIFEARANNIQIQLFEPFILKAINLALNSGNYNLKFS